MYKRSQNYFITYIHQLLLDKFPKKEKKKKKVNQAPRELVSVSEHGSLSSFCFFFSQRTSEDIQLAWQTHHHISWGGGGEERGEIGMVKKKGYSFCQSISLTFELVACVVHCIRSIQADDAG